MALKIRAWAEMFTGIYLNAGEVNTNLTISIYWVKESGIF